MLPRVVFREFPGELLLELLFLMPRNGMMFGGLLMGRAFFQLRASHNGCGRDGKDCQKNQ